MNRMKKKGMVMTGRKRRLENAALKTEEKTKLHFAKLEEKKQKSKQRMMKPAK